MINYHINILKDNISLQSLSDYKILRNIPIVEDTFDNGKLVDEIAFKYSLKKTLDSLENNSNLYINYSSKNNIFRTHNIEGLKKNEIEDYFKYNKEEIIPLDLGDYKIVKNYNDPILEIYGIENTFVQAIEEVLDAYKFNKAYLTFFPSEVISFSKNKKIKNVLYLNFQSHFLEFCGIVDYQVKVYGFYEFDPIDAIDFDIEDKKNSLAIFKIKNKIDELIVSYENIFKGTYEIFASGDRNILGIYNLSTNREIDFQGLFDKDYLI